MFRYALYLLKFLKEPNNTEVFLFLHEKQSVVVVQNDILHWECFFFYKPETGNRKNRETGKTGKTRKYLLFFIGTPHDTALLLLGRCCWDTTGPRRNPQSTSLLFPTNHLWFHSLIYWGKVKYFGLCNRKKEIYSAIRNNNCVI